MLEGLRSPWTVLRTIYTDCSNIKDVSLWPERDYGSTSSHKYTECVFPKDEQPTPTTAIVI